MIKRIILSGGGTGGHIYPAVAVAEALQRRCGDGVELLFVGAEGKMEMEKIPALGYRIVGLPTAGLQRRFALSNLALPFKVLKSVGRARRTIREFGADVVVGFGGYASGPVLWAAQRSGIPTLIQEQNSYAGLTNKILARGARRICVAYDGMERFFPAERIVHTGNPLRGRFAVPTEADRLEGAAAFGLDAARPTVLVVGGSLGCRTLNETMKAWLARQEFRPPFQVIWQTGKYYEAEMRRFLEEHPAPGVWQGAFIDRMDRAYAAADVVVSRSGACSVSELCLVGKPTLFVPSPNVAEDHQTKNAQALVDRQAAVLVADAEAPARAMETAGELLADPARRRCSPATSRRWPCPTRRSGSSTKSKKSGKMEIQRIYFIGIGGIGMSALARYFLHEGREVAGYDRTQSALTEALAAEGAAIHYTDDTAAIPAPFREREGTVVVYTPAVPGRPRRTELVPRPRLHRRETVADAGPPLGRQIRDGRGRYARQDHHLDARRMAQPRGRRDRKRLSGRHLEKLRQQSGAGRRPRLAVEADEFDRSFLRLRPDVAVVTAVDADHLDIYGTHEAVKEAFAQFIERIRPGGALVLKAGVDVALRNDAVTVYRYAYDTPCDFYARDVRLIEGGHYRYDLVTPSGVIADCTLGIPGWVNVENAVAAVAAIWCAARAEGGTLDTERLRRALAAFEGVKRRFEFYVNTPRQVYMDDYAHHPRELAAALTSVRRMFPGRRVTAVFQPHLYTRTRDFYREFAEALSQADEVLLLPIYPAREEPIEGIASEIIAERVTVPCRIVGREALAATLGAAATDVVVSFGAGNIDACCDAVADVLRKKA